LRVKSGLESIKTRLARNTIYKTSDGSLIPN